MMKFNKLFIALTTVFSISSLVACGDKDHKDAIADHFKGIKDEVWEALVETTDSTKNGIEEQRENLKKELDENIVQPYKKAAAAAKDKASDAKEKIQKALTRTKAEIMKRKNEIGEATENKKKRAINAIVEGLENMEKDLKKRKEKLEKKK